MIGNEFLPDWVISQLMADNITEAQRMARYDAEMAQLGDRGYWTKRALVLMTIVGVVALAVALML